MNMASYKMPPDMKEKEKIIGGILTLVQFFWVLIGLALGAGFFVIGFGIIGGKASLIFGGIIALSGVPFVVYKKNNLTLFQYLRFKRAFKKKTHRLPNIRKEVDF